MSLEIFKILKIKGVGKLHFSSRISIFKIFSLICIFPFRDEWIDVYEDAYSGDYLRTLNAVKIMTQWVHFM